MSTPTTEIELGYVAFYYEKRTEVRGKGLDLYSAKQQAIKQMNVPKSKRHMVTILLAEKDGEQVVHTPDF